MNTRKVHPLIEELIIAASNNNVPQMKNIIQAIPVFQEIRNLESHAYNKLDLKNCISDEININCANKDNNPALVVAAKKGHMEVVDELLSVEADPNVKDSAGSTALIYSAIYGHEKLVKRLISAQADLNIQNEYNDTALAEAAFNDHLSVVKLLVEAKADLNTPCNEGKTALMWAIMKKNINVIEYLLQNSSISLEVFDNNGETALDLAVKRHQLGIVELLMKKDSIINNPEELLYMLNVSDQRQPEVLNIFRLLFDDQMQTIDKKLAQAHLKEDQQENIKKQIHYMKKTQKKFQRKVYNTIDQLTLFPVELTKMIIEYDFPLGHNQTPVYYKEEEKQNSCLMQ